MAAAIDKSLDWNYEGAEAAEQQRIPVVVKLGFICEKLKSTPLAAGGHHHYCEQVKGGAANLKLGGYRCSLT